MELTVGILKKILSELDDDVILADLGFGNNKFHPFMNLKRLLLLQGDVSWNNQKFLTINSMGCHFSDEGEHSNLKYLGKHWDEETLKDKL